MSSNALFPSMVIEPIIDTTTSATQATFGTNPVFNFNEGEFSIGMDGKVKIASAYDSWAIWCYKALNTVRYRFPIYDSDYGSELESLIATTITSTSVMQSEIIRMVNDALITDPRTKSVDNFAFTWQNNTVMFSCLITSILGDTSTLGITL